MNRRNFLSSAAIGAAGVLIPGTPMFERLLKAADAPPSIQAGWIDSPAARRRFLLEWDKPLFSQWDQEIRGSGDGKQVLLYKAYEKVTGKLYQPRKQTIGDCVGEGSGLATDMLTAVQCVQNGDEWKGDCAFEVIYAGGRVQIAGDVGHADGSNGVDAANWLNKYGVILRGKYGDIDLSTYRPDLERQWAASRKGVPQQLQDLAKQHPVKTIARVDSFEQLADAIANGYLVILCSNQGFNDKRDEQGYLRPSGSWSHCMCCCGVDTVSDRKGALLENSWGSTWVNGPEGSLGCPLGGFWADAHVIDRMCKQHDSYAISNFLGYPAQDIDYKLW